MVIEVAGGQTSCQVRPKRSGGFSLGFGITEGPGRVPQPVALPCDVSSQGLPVAEAYQSVRARKQRVSHEGCMFVVLLYAASC